MPCKKRPGVTSIEFPLKTLERVNALVAAYEKRHSQHVKRSFVMREIVQRGLPLLEEEYGIKRKK